MDSRIEHQLVNVQNLPLLNGQFSVSTLPWESILSRKREQLATLVKKCGLFDASTIHAFDQTREPNGTYRIDAGDSLLINNAKCVINLLYCLEVMKPSLLNPLANYLRSDAWVEGSIHYLLFLSGYAYQKYRTLKEFKFYVRNLNYYLSKLKKDFSPLSAVGNSLAASIFKLSIQLKQNVEPYLTSIPFLESVEDNTEQKQSTNDDSEKNLVLKICATIDDLRDKIDTCLVKQDASIVAEKNTGLYPENLTNDHTIRNLIHSANTLVRFKAALLKIDGTINHLEIHLYDVCSDLGNTIKELQQLNIESIKKFSAFEFLRLIKIIIIDIEPIFVEMTRLIEFGNNRLGVNNQGVQEQLDKAFQSYQLLAQTLNVQLSKQYPYLEERLFIKRAELQRKEHEIKGLLKARKIIAKNTINEKTTLQHLLIARKAARKIGTPNMYYYEKEINLQIDAHTGLNSLEADISKLEKQIRTTISDELRSKALKGLRDLYARRRQFEDKLEKLEGGDPTQTEKFSYNTKTQSFVDQTRPGPWFGFFGQQSEDRIREPKAATLRTADEMMAGLTRDCDRLHHEIDVVEDQIISTQLNTSNQQILSLRNLKLKIDNTSYLDLYLLPIEELQNMLEQIHPLGDPDVANYEEILLTVRNERLTALAMPEKVADYSYFHFSTYEFERSAVTRLLNRRCLQNIEDGDLIVLGRPVNHESQQRPHISVEQSDDKIIKRLKNQFKGVLVLKSESTRKKIFILIRQHLAQSEFTAFEKSKLPTGLYSNSVTDSILIKTLKSLLNSMLLLEEVLIRIQPHLRNIAAGKGQIPCAIYGLPSTHAAFLDMQLQLKDFSFYLEQLNTSFPLLADATKLPLITAAYSLASSTFVTVKAKFATPEASSIIPSDITLLINQVLIQLNTITQASNPSNDDVVFTPIQRAITALDEFIYTRYGKQRKKNGQFQTQEAGEDQNFKDILIVANTLKTALKTLQRLAATADTGRFKDILSIATSSYNIYKEIKQLYKKRTLEIKSALKNIIELMHPLLVQMAANAELMEIKLGLHPGVVQNKMAVVCTKFEKTADKFCVTFPSYYPYTCEKIDILSEELRIERENHAALLGLHKIITENDSNKTANLNVSAFTLSHFVTLRDALRLLPPSITYVLLGAIEHAIARRTGLSNIEDKIRNQRKNLVTRDTVILKLEKILIAIQIRKDSLEYKKNIIEQFQHDLLNCRKFPYQKVQLLHSLYIEDSERPLSFKQFCHLLITTPEFFNLFLARAKENLEQRLKLVDEELKTNTTKITQTTMVYTQDQISLQRLEKMAEELRKRIAEVNLPSVAIKEFSYVDNSIVNNTYNLYTAGSMPYNPAIIPALFDYVKYYEQRIDKLTMQRSTMVNQQKKYITDMFYNHRIQLENAEKSIGLKAGTLTSLIPDDINDLKKSTQIACELSHARGVLANFISYHTGKVSSNYATILAKPESASTLAREMSREAAKHSSPIGRFFRKIIHMPSTRDEFITLAKYYPAQADSNKTTVPIPDGDAIKTGSNEGFDPDEIEMEENLAYKETPVTSPSL